MSIQKHKYKFKAYSEEFPKLYKQEERKLRKILPKNIKMEHVGSTAVPGLGGKGIIDIMAVVRKKDIKKSMKRLGKLGFDYRPQPKDSKRKFFQKIIRRNKKERRVHVHLIYKKDIEISLIAFREYLKKHKEARDMYVKLKRKAVKHAKGEGKKYRTYKEKFIKSLTKKALKEYNN